MDRNALADLLKRHRPADRTEAGHRDRMRLLLDMAIDPFARDQYQPGHFTASAFVLSPARDAILLVLHTKLGLWVQPGGHVEPTDTDIFAAARREVVEETGIRDLVAEKAHPDLLDVDVHAIPPFGDQAAHEHFDVRVLFRATSLQAVPGAGVKDARWVPLDAVADAGTDESVRRAVRKIRLAERSLAG